MNQLCEKNTTDLYCAGVEDSSYLRINGYILLLFIALIFYY